jgi:hypothetical protein
VLAKSVLAGLLLSVHTGCGIPAFTTMNLT